MTLYIPSFSEDTLIEQYRMRGWTASYGCGAQPFPYTAPPGWSCDPSYPEVIDPVQGTHGGCYNCRMVELQVIANYQTEITFITNPDGAKIFIDDVEWWPDAVTTLDGATFRGISIATEPTPHTYELRKDGYVSATGTFELAEGIPITITKNLVPLGIKVTNIVPDVTTCAALCDVNVEVTWINDALTDIEFTPSLMIDGVPISSAPYPPEILSPNMSVTHSFLISELTIPYHEICAIPDIGTHCVTIIVLTPANIISTALTLSTNDCTEPCNVTGSISWTNNGGSTGTFDPSILINNVPTSLGPIETIDPEQIITHEFSLPPDLLAGIYDICASPGTHCQTVNVKTPANITTTNITLTPLTCLEPCNVDIDVTYVNTGQTAGIFTPEITIDGIPVLLAPDILYPSINIVKTFTLTDKTNGIYTICAVPIGTTTCQTLIIDKIQESGIGLFIIGGLAIGALLMSRKK